MTAQWRRCSAAAHRQGSRSAGFHTDLLNGVFGLFPLNPKKDHQQKGDKGDLVLYAQCVIFHKAGGAIERDSDFGQQTVTRVMDVQRLFEMPTHGEIDGPTWATIDFLASR